MTEEVKEEDDYEDYLAWKKQKGSRNSGYSNDPMGLNSSPMKTNDTYKSGKVKD